MINIIEFIKKIFFLDDNFKEELSIKEKEYTSLQEKMKKIEYEYSKLKNELKEKESEITGWSKNIIVENLNNTVKSKDCEINNLKSVLFKNEKQIEELNKEINEKNYEVQILKGNIENIINKIGLKEEIDELYNSREILKGLKLENVDTYFEFIIRFYDLINQTSYLKKTIKELIENNVDLTSFNKIYEKIIKSIPNYELIENTDNNLDLGIHEKINDNDGTTIKIVYVKGYKKDNVAKLKSLVGVE